MNQGFVNSNTALVLRFDRFMNSNTAKLGE